MIWFAVLLCQVGSFFVRPNHGDSFRCPHIDIWEDLLSRIDFGYNLMKRERFNEARVSLAEVSRVVSSNLTESFECSIGVSALFRALAYAYAGDKSFEQIGPVEHRRANQIGLRMMHVSMNWLTHAFVKKGLNDGRWVDESAWPISISEINQEETYILNTIGRTGPQGHRPVWDDCPTGFRDKSLKIAIVSLCDYPPENPLPRLSQSNRQLYSNRHGYRIIERNQRFDSSRPHAWAKISLLSEYILSPDIDWLLWFDCDTYFMNFNVTLDHFLYRYGAAPEGGLEPDFRMLIQEDHSMINTGVFFIKTGEWSKGLLERVYGDNSSPWIDHPWWENAAFSHEFLGDLPVRIESHGYANFSEADDMLNIYPRGVKVAPQSLFNSYHPITSRLVMHDNWEPGKFVLAFSGCKSGSSPAVVNILYANYYRVMCQLNNVNNDCINVNDLRLEY